MNEITAWSAAQGKFVPADTLCQVCLGEGCVSDMRICGVLSDNEATCLACGGMGVTAVESV